MTHNEKKKKCKCSRCNKYEWYEKDDTLKQKCCETNEDYSPKQDCCPRANIDVTSKLCNVARDGIVTESNFAVSASGELETLGVESFNASLTEHSESFTLNITTTRKIKITNNTSETIKNLSVVDTLGCIPIDKITKINVISTCTSVKPERNIDQIKSTYNLVQLGSCIPPCSICIVVVQMTYSFLEFSLRNFNVGLNVALTDPTIAIGLTYDNFDLTFSNSVTLSSSTVVDGVLSDKCENTRSFRPICIERCDEMTKLLKAISPCVVCKEHVNSPNSYASCMLSTLISNTIPE